MPAVRMLGSLWHRGTGAVGRERAGRPGHPARHGGYATPVPSYRTILTVSTLRPGHGPRAVEEAARAAVTATTTLEDFAVDVVGGEPRVTVRFTGADDAEAFEVHAATLSGVREVAAVPRAVLAVVRGGRSVPLAS